MSWFDDIFGQSKNKQKNKEKENENISFDHGSEDEEVNEEIYKRPRGKFRFPIDMDVDAETETETEQNSDQEHDSQQEYNYYDERFYNENEASYPTNRRRRRRRSHDGEEAPSEPQPKKDKGVYENKRLTRPSSTEQYSSVFKKKSVHDKEDDAFNRRLSSLNQPKFHASEVPSAIFGMRKQKDVPNSGLKEPSTPDTSNIKEEDNKDSNGYESTDNQSSNSEVVRDTPTYSKTDNTINIENIYASQIVSEIRKEREKKLQKKKQFEKALREKREQELQNIQSEEEKSQIKQQDEFFKKQASFIKNNQIDEEPEDNTEETTTEDIKSSDDYITQPNSDENELKFEEESSKESLQPDVNDMTTYEFKEINLDIDEEPEEQKQQQEENLDVEEIDGIEPAKEENSNEYFEEEVIEGVDSAFNGNENNDNFKEDNFVEDDIEFEEVPETTNEDFEEKDDDEELSFIDDEFTTSEKELNETEDTQSKVEISESNEELEDKSQLRDEPKNKKKSLEPVLKPNNKKSSPFNVVMTPSDKKKYHTFKNQTSTNVKQETKVNNASENNQTNNDFDNESLETVTKRKGPSFVLPPLTILDDVVEQEDNTEWLEEKKKELDEAFYHFNVPAHVVNMIQGPTVTRFELSVEKGVKVSRITALQDDIKMALAAKDIRIEAPIPGTSLVGIEVPNQTPRKIPLGQMITSKAFQQAESKLTVAMGFKINNEPLLMDISKTPHALIAGATGSGKSVCINAILTSLLYKNHPDELKLLLIDPKMVELAPYNDLPHLVSPVITDVKAATASLKWAVEEMEKRYKEFAELHVRNITAYNKKATYEKRMPKIVIVIDELADLMMMSPQEVEQSIARIAQKARACGIHMILATQRPSVNVITGLIKANVPTRISFMVSSSIDSRTILDVGGAEKLLGNGDMLYLGNGMNKPIRVQGAFVSDDEIDETVSYVSDQMEPNYLFKQETLLKKVNEQPADALFDDVCEFMVNEGHISTSLIQRHFQIGYNRAARMIDNLEANGFISGPNGSKPREVLISKDTLENGKTNI
ncbi:DNA translocase FtsK [Mammaliicoccus lentus]|uniref:DNA translocase FtsK n=1 Tax=Mammaliicoccus lentus TaxID=42858 RepID=UPI00085C481D|nr:DNA translocase FtsK [Mammaliicoccus lentus]